MHKDEKYIYDRGFGPCIYICSDCGSYKLVQHQRGGFTPPYYICDDCDEEVLSPKWEMLEIEKIYQGEVPEPKLTEAEEMKKIQMDLAFTQLVTPGKMYLPTLN